MNIAETIIEGYNSKDFKDNYFFALGETFSDQKGDIINRIQDLFNISNYETQKELTNWKYLDKAAAGKVYEFINENLEDFCRNFNGFWVGPTSLESIEFGEQEEQLTGLYNYKSKKSYDLKYMQHVFDKAGYYVKGEYAYYNLQAGLHIDLLKDVPALDNFLLTV